MCYHIVRWYDSVRCGPALKTCYRTKSTAQTIRHRGIVGDRSPFHLEPHNADTHPLGVVQCRNAEQCECHRWPNGHNAAALPAKPVRSLIMCEQCNQGRRTAVEMIDPKTEEPMLLCERCAGRAALGYAFKRQVPLVRRVHADDAAMVMVVSSSVG